MNKKIDEILFTRSLSAVDKDGKKITSFISQPYCIGVYCIVDNNPALQLSHSWKGYEKWVKGSVKKMEKQGYTVTLSQQPLVNYLSEEYIREYVLK